MGMLLRRRFAEADAPAEEPTEDLEGAQTPESAPEGSEGQEDGTEGSGDSQETEGAGDESTPQAAPEDGRFPAAPNAPTRNASKADWLAFLGIEDDGRSRDELAESVLGPKQ